MDYRYISDKDRILKISKLGEDQFGFTIEGQEILLDTSLCYRVLADLHLLVHGEDREVRWCNTYKSGLQLWFPTKVEATDYNLESEELVCTTKQVQEVECTRIKL